LSPEFAFARTFYAVLSKTKPQKMAKMPFSRISFYRGISAVPGQKSRFQADVGNSKKIGKI